MQQLFFIRHAIAMEREEHVGSDLKRPLTEEGRRKARKAFRGLDRSLEPPLLIISSAATRAYQTAALLREIWPRAKYLELADLNPGAGPEELQQILTSRRNLERIALVGHEPDFSEMIASLVSMDGSTALAVKKASLVEVQLFSANQGMLVSLIPPKVLRRLGGG